MKIVEIKWADSHGVTSDWEFKNEMKPLRVCYVTSVGYLWDENEDCTTLLQSDSDKQVLGRLSIPAGCIISKRVLAES